MNYHQHYCHDYNHFYQHYNPSCMQHHNQKKITNTTTFHQNAIINKNIPIKKTDPISYHFKNHHNVTHHQQTKSCLKRIINQKHNYERKRTKVN